MPILWDSVIATLIEYPFWSHLNCSNDSAFSSVDWGSAVSSRSVGQTISIDADYVCKNQHCQAIVSIPRFSHRVLCCDEK